LPTDSATVAENEKEVKMEGRTVEHSAITMAQLILPEQGVALALLTVARL
jgi:hypothetical protein